MVNVMCISSKGCIKSNAKSPFHAWLVFTIMFETSSVYVRVNVRCPCRCAVALSYVEWFLCAATEWWPSQHQTVKPTRCVCVFLKLSEKCSSTVLVHTHTQLLVGQALQTWSTPFWFRRHRNYVLAWQERGLHHP